MNIEKFREYCLSMDGVTEKIPFAKFAPRFESLLVFYVLDHMFCLIDMDDFTSVSIRSTAEEIEELELKFSSILPPANKAMKYWIRVGLGGDISDKEIYALTRRAYEIVKARYVKS